MHSWPVCTDYVALFTIAPTASIIVFGSQYTLSEEFLMNNNNEKENDFLIKPKYLIINNSYIRSWKPLRQASTEVMKKSCINEDPGKGTTDKEWAGGCLNVQKYKS